MDDRRALMAGIIANPDEDTPRLAFADWLDEHGDAHDRARAEFIRLQIAANAATNAGETTLLPKRAVTLYKKHAKRWLGGLVALAAKHDSDMFTRGLLRWWNATAGEFLKKDHQTTVCEWFPRVGVELLILRETSKRVKALMASPALAWVTVFRWWDAKIEDDGFAALAESPHTERLTRLEIDKPRCSDKGLKALANSTSYPNLRALSLSDGLWRGSFTTAGVRLLLDSKRFPRLDELGLTGAHTHAATNRTLWTFKSLSRLRVLNVGFDTDTTALAKCPHLTGLEELHVASSTLEDADAQILADNPALTRLKVLALTGMNSYHTRLSAGAEKALRDRFGENLTLNYSVLCRE